jgi:hypothetical protein
MDGSKTEAQAEQVEEKPLLAPIVGEAVAYFPTGGLPAKAAIITRAEPRLGQDASAGLVSLMLISPGPEKGAFVGHLALAQSFDCLNNVPHSPVPKPGHWSRVREVRAARS